MYPVIAPEMTSAMVQVVVYFMTVVAMWMGWTTVCRA